MKILIVCPQPEYTSDTKVGVQVRIKKFAESFSRKNQVVSLNATSKVSKINQKDDDDNKDVIYYFKQPFLGGVCLSPFTDFNARYLFQLRKIARAEKIDSIFIIGGPYGVISARLICPNIPVIFSSESVKYDSTYLTFEIIKNHIPLFNTLIIRNFSKFLLTSYLRMLERWTCKQASHISVLSDQIKVRYQQLYGLKSTKFSVIPGYIGSSRFRIDPNEMTSQIKNDKIRIVFHGPYSNPANADAAQLILNYIAPEVHRRNQQIQFIIAGAGMPVFEKDNMKSLGFVEDLAGLLESCDIAIIPMLYGEGGVKGKVRDYMAAGLPIISTKEGLTGVDAENGKHAIIIEAVDKRFVDAILDLADNKDKRLTLGNNALELAKRSYDPRIIDLAIDNMLAKLNNG